MIPSSPKKHACSEFIPDPICNLKMEPVAPQGFINTVPIYTEAGGPCKVEPDLPPDFLEPLSPQKCIQIGTILQPGGMHLSPQSQSRTAPQKDLLCRHFWKAGDYEGSGAGQVCSADGIDRVRVHPKFLHSNATSHKWALGAMAELLDNTVDEVINGATFVKVDMIRNPENGSPMLIIEDDGGGMTPDCIRRCMSLGYSRKSKDAELIGQYGNGFKTSTMRLGADVIVFSCTSGGDNCCGTKSIGMLSYTFLRETGQQDIIVPMVDYELHNISLQKLVRSSLEDWNQNMEMIKQWSPYKTEVELLMPFNEMKSQGTKIVIYNLWENDEGELELDFDTDPFDIQLRGTNRDEKKILLAKQNPNSMQYFTYRYSLRSYASILYLQLPKDFKIVLRGREVHHHSLVNDLMLTQKLTYKPHYGLEKEQKENALPATVTIGFVKDAKKHIDVQGFNVYHKNRLIKPFWRIWNSGSSNGRGIIGVLEANFVEPAHDKQGFELTNVLARLEARLLRMQRSYWYENCHKIGYSSRRFKKKLLRLSKEQSLLLDQNHEETLAPPRRAAKQEECCSPSFVKVTKAVRSTRHVLSQGYQTAASSSETFADQECEMITVSECEHANDKVIPSSATCRSSEPIAIPLNFTNNRMEGTFTESMTGTKSCKQKRVFSALSSLNVIQEKCILLEIERRRKLEARIGQLEHEVEALHKSIGRVTNERDNVRNLLEEEHRQGAAEDEELRKKLKETLVRVRDLEVQNYMLRSARS